MYQSRNRLISTFSFLFAVSIAALSPQLLAQQKTDFLGSEDAVDNRIASDQREQALPMKQRLAKQHIQLAIDYSAAAVNASNVLSDKDDFAVNGMLRFYGSWDMLNAGSADAGGLVWKLEHRHSYTDTPVKGIEFNAGGLGIVSPVFSDEGARLTNLYWRQRFNDHNATLTVGYLDATDYADVFALASPWTGFMNFAFSTGATTMALPSDSAFGVAGGTMLNQNVFVIGGIVDMESDPTEPLKSAENFFNKNHYFKSIELGYTSGKEKIFVNNLHLTAWHADNSEQLNQDSDSGINLSASWMIGKWLPFVRAGFADKGSLLGIDRSVSAGVGYFGLGGANNNLGFGINLANVVGNSDNQVTGELFYLFKPVPFFEITPDIQFIQNPALNPDKSQIWLVGLRSRLIW